jgi:hypothetical protein
LAVWLGAYMRVTSIVLMRHGEVIP